MLARKLHSVSDLKTSMKKANLEKLSKEQYGGKYSIYKFDALPRGRVWYDLEEKTYKIVFYRGSKEFINAIAPKIKELFGITEADITIASIEN